MTTEDDVRARVRHLIDTSGRGQGEFADAVGIDPTKLSEALTGARCFTPLELALIAEWSGASIDWLLGWGSAAMTTANYDQAVQRATREAVYDYLSQHPHTAVRDPVTDGAEAAVMGAMPAIRVAVEEGTRRAVAEYLAEHGLPTTPGGVA